MGRPFPLKIAPSHGGSGPPSDTWFPGRNQVLNPNGISLGLAVFEGLTSVTDWHTDTRSYSAGNNRPHLRTSYAGLWSRSRRLGLETVSRCINVSSRSGKANVLVSAIDVSCPRPIFCQILQVTIIKLINQVSRRSLQVLDSWYNNASSVVTVSETDTET